MTDAEKTPGAYHPDSGGLATRAAVREVTRDGTTLANTGNMPPLYREPGEGSGE